MSVQHCRRGKPREGPVELSQYFSGVPIIKDQLKSNERDPRTSLFKPMNQEMVDHNIHACEALVEWEDHPELGVFSDFSNIRTPIEYMKEIKNRGGTAKVIQEVLKSHLRLVGFASRETENNAWGKNQKMKDKNIAVVISEPTSVIITEPNGVKPGDWLTFQVPDPSYPCNRYLVTFEKLDKLHEHAGALKNGVALKRIPFEGQGLMDIE